MIIFGWLCLLGITLYFVFATVASAMVSAGFSGKIDKSAYVFGIIAAALIYATYVNFPFIVKVAA